MTTIHRLGLDAVLVEVDAGRASALAAWGRWALPGVSDVVAGASSVLFDGCVDVATVVDLVGQALATGVNPPVEDALTAVVDVPTTFDGPDLAEVSKLWGLSPAAAVDVLCRLEFTSEFCGFAPGFAYLRGLPWHLSVPRRSDPRPRVRPGSVALADRWCGIYPTASPGGWQLIGHTALDLFDPSRTPPALLAPGVRVRLVAM